MTVFSPMDSWIAAAGSTDDWLSLGLDVLERWQAGSGDGAGSDDGTGPGQSHLVAVLASLQVLRPVTPDPPDPLVLAVWFHHAGTPDTGRLSGPAVLELSAMTAHDRLSALGDPALAREVARLVRAFGVRHPKAHDVASGLLGAAHRAAVSPVHLTAVPPVTPPFAGPVGSAG